MLEFLPKEVREGLQAALSRGRRKGSRLHLQLGDQVFPVLRIWTGGLALDAGRTQHLRGSVDLYDGPRHVGHCLIIASTLENDELICDFKSYTAVLDQPPVDFERGEHVPAGYLPRL